MEIEPDNSIESAKALGAFYTDAQIANFLVWWSVRSPHDVVMDPSFGGGVFLRSACVRLKEIGGNPSHQVYGVEIDQSVLKRIAEKLKNEFGIIRRNLVLSDFFDIHAPTIPGADVIVGNPPFIRYQRFKGETRERAIKRAKEQGVHLSKLSSSWAPFLVHSISMLNQGGRLAMVIPMEIGHAVYAQPILEHLRIAFHQVSFLTFRKKLFTDLNEDTLLLLAEGKGSGPARFYIRDLANAGLLREVQESGKHRLTGVRRMDEVAIGGGRQRLIEYLIPKKALELYEELKDTDTVVPLGEFADVGIGYVTGANDFFHLSPEDAQEWNVPSRYLKRAVRRGRSLTGLRFTESDWAGGLDTGETGYLLHVEGDGIPEGVREYIAHGENLGVPGAYKCRTRSPWYTVPHVYMPDAFLTYMSGDTPQLVANDADAVAPNSLHILRVRNDLNLTGDALAALWMTSLTRLSAEIEGHALGGGMLKLEPTEAGNVLMPMPDSGNGELVELGEELDGLVREGRYRGAQKHADKLVLQQKLGIDSGDISILMESAELLRARRYARGRSQ